MKPTSIRISYSEGNINATIQLPSSKSESNRVLIINALYQKFASKQLPLFNLSTARDTVTMQRLLNSNELELNVLDAGTTMRFLIAYCVATQREAILTGTTRMCQRPIALLVNALRELGADITYLKQEGYPPIHIKVFSARSTNYMIAIRGDISSQYISALLLIAPLLPDGLQLELTGNIASRPYIQMTLNLMAHFGISYQWKENKITINNQSYQPATYDVESDWSAASYWYSIVALSKEAKIKLLGLKKDSLQGDKAIVEIMDKLGVATDFEKDGILLTKKVPQKHFYYDFTDCPDLAQTIAVIGAALQIDMKLTGLKSLKIKETDRIIALENELLRFGIKVIIENDSTLLIAPQSFTFSKEIIKTYKDHRMAMAFAPLALLGEINIAQPEVVEKSYPHFWEDLIKAGFTIT